MTVRFWLRNLFSSRTPRTSRKARARYRPRLEALEDRTMLNSSLAAPAGSVGRFPSAAVANTAPTITSISVPATGTEGSPLNLSATGTDPDGDTVLYQWAITPPGGYTTYYGAGGATSLTWTPPESGTFGVILYLHDSANFSNFTVSPTMSIAVANVPPTPTLSGYSTGLVSQVLNLTAAATDPGSADQAAGFTYHINWGDGSPIQTISAAPGNGSGVTLNHFFATAGTYTVDLTATDRAGGAESVSSTVTVLPATSANLQTVLNQQGAILLQNPTEVLDGKTVTFTAMDLVSPLSEQWQVSTDGGKTFTNIQGATAPTLTFPATLARNGEELRDVFTNPQGTLATPIATLTEAIPPVVTAQPTNQTVAVNGTATFTATGSGYPAPTIQWQVSTDGGKTFTNAANGSADSLIVTAPSTPGMQFYRAVFTSPAGRVISKTVALRVDVPPTIITQPLAQTVNLGQVAVFTAKANGTPVPTVQWQVSSDGGATWTNLAGATSTTLSFTAGSRVNGDLYRAVFTNPLGHTITSAVSLTVDKAPPVVTKQPSNETVLVSGTATFTAVANGNPAPAVQWQVSTDGGKTFHNLAGGTADTLNVLPGTWTPGVYLYRAVFSSPLGSATSRTVALTESIEPSILTQPLPQVVNAGATALFTATASGTPTPRVQWQVSTDWYNWSNLAGATSTTLRFTAQPGEDGNLYRAVFTDPVATRYAVISDPVELTVNAAPVVIEQPSNLTLAVNGTSWFYSWASGEPAPSVQWQVSTDGGKTFTNAAGGTWNDLMVTAPATPGVQLYRAIFTNSLGSVTSKTVTLTVEARPAIVTQPSSQTVNLGQTAVFTAEASGTPAPTVRWQVSSNGGATWTTLAGATSTTLSVSTQSRMNGDLYRAIFTNPVGQTITSAVSLTVDNAPPVVITQPSNQAVAVNGTATFTATADGNPAPAVQWQVSTDHGRTFAPLAGATSDTLPLSSVTAADNGNVYRAVFTSPLGTVTTRAVTLTVDVPPGVTRQPVSEAVRVGQAVTFTAAASGTTPRVQWQVSTDQGRTFTNLPGATSTTLTFTAAARQNGYRYRAVFTNAVGQVISDSVELVIW